MPQPLKKKTPWILEEDPKVRERRRLEEAEEFLKNSWELAEGLEYEESGQKKYIQKAWTPEHPAYPLTWNRHHDTLAAIGADGRLYVTPWTQKKEDQLRSLFNNRDESLGVPFSGNEMPAHPDVRRRWEEKQLEAKSEKERAEEERKTKEQNQ